MATHDYVLDNASGAAFRTDLNNALAAIQSNNSNNSSPATTVAYQWWADTTNGVLKIRNSANNDWVELLQLDGTLTLEDGSESAPALAFRTDLNSGIFNGGGDNIRVSTGGSTRLTIDSSGNVGIGTVNADRRIHCHNSSNTTNVRAKFTNGTTGEGASDGFEIGINASDPAEAAIVNYENSPMLFHTGGTEAMRIDNSQRLLIGTINAISSSGERTLQIQNSGGPKIALGRNDTSIGSGNTIGGIEFYGNDFNQGFVNTASILVEADGEHGNDDKPVRMEFHTTNSSTTVERMRITKSGFAKHTSDAGNYVSDTGTFHEFRSNSGNQNNTVFFHNGVGNTQFGIKISTANEQNDTSHNYIDCREGGSAIRRFIVFANGNVQNQNNSYGSLSDEKLKENITDANSQWNDIKALKVRNFNFINDSNKVKCLGLVAQEAETVCPSLVFESPDQEDDPVTGEIKDKGTKTKSLKYSVLYMKAIKCLQEAITKIETLETKVAALEAG